MDGTIHTLTFNNIFLLQSLKKLLIWSVRAKSKSGCDAVTKSNVARHHGCRRVVPVWTGGIQTKLESVLVATKYLMCQNLADILLTYEDLL